MSRLLSLPTFLTVLVTKITEIVVAFVTCFFYYHLKLEPSADWYITFPSLHFFEVLRERGVAKIKIADFRKEQ